MRSHLGKCEKLEREIAVLGVKTRARASMAMATTVTSSTSSFSAKKIGKFTGATKRCNVHHHKNRHVLQRVFVASKENSDSSSSNFLPETTSSSSDSSSGEVISSDYPGSCCSSNNASSSNEIIADPEIESAQTSSKHLHCRNEARRESKLRDDDKLDSPPFIVAAKSTVQIKMPSDTEIEEFFAAAEKNLHKRFADKYNFDVVKEIPLKGRYEWVPIKP